MKKGLYNFCEIEERWRRHWLEQRTFRTDEPVATESSDKPKCYVLDMFPYPSGSGLHVGHPKGYIATDIYSRYKKMRGFNVLHPMGFDSFGLPAEQYAIEHGVHPAVVTEQNIDTIREQLQFLGLGYDWDREIATSREDYYRWTQWMFKKFFESWFDSSLQKGRPISELIEELDNGTRQLSDADREVAGPNQMWGNLTNSQRSSVLNNYRIAYHKEVIVNWCPKLGTVLANEEVTSDGKSERGNFLVYQRPLRQWMMRITAYSERLLNDLDVAELPDGKGGTFQLNWPESIKLMQRNWIGRSQGSDVKFDVLYPETNQIANVLTVYTTRPDTLFGATFMVVAPQHPIVTKGSSEYLVPPSYANQVETYIAKAKKEVPINHDTKEKTGIISGIYARNPVNGEKLPIFVADYVSMDYGSGAIMAVPAHDERDFEFAQKYDLPITKVVQAIKDNAEGCFTGEGISINSGDVSETPFAITSLSTPEAKEKITKTLEEHGQGKTTVNYKLRDWIFSRQRYWGEPFPIAIGPDGDTISVDPPVILPEMENFRPETSDDPNSPVRPPLSRADKSWKEIETDGKKYKRELNVMPQWAGSCWYFLRFIDPKNDQAFCDDQKERFFMPVDLYVGGAEHAVLHLLYSRFWHKVLYDLGHVSAPEPFKKLFNQGMITADAFANSQGVYIDIREVELHDGEPYHTKTGEKLTRFSGKMGKRYKNGLPPEEVGKEYGVDTLRLYEMYMGPLETSAPWSMEGIRGMQRFLQRVWRNFVTEDRTPNLVDGLTPELEKLQHKTILKVTDDLENLRFNTAIAALIEFNNELVQMESVPKEVGRVFLLLLAPFAPHIAEEIWEICQFSEHELSDERFPTGDPEKAKDDEITIAVQIQGKMRGTIQVPASATDEKMKMAAKSDPKIAKRLEGNEIRRVIIVPQRLINFII